MKTGKLDESLKQKETCFLFFRRNQRGGRTLRRALRDQVRANRIQCITVKHLSHSDPANTTVSKPGNPAGRPLSLNGPSALPRQPGGAWKMVARSCGRSMGILARLSIYIASPLSRADVFGSKNDSPQTPPQYLWHGKKSQRCLMDDYEKPRA